MIGGISIPMGISNLGASKIIGASVTPGGNRIVGDTGMTSRPEGIACLIATPFTKARSASCSASASEVAANINAENTGVSLSKASGSHVASRNVASAV
jgi:hypothetical protein